MQNKKEFELSIIDKTIDEIILTYKDINIINLRDIMNDFPLNRYSHKLIGNNMYHYQV